MEHILFKNLRDVGRENRAILFFNIPGLFETLFSNDSLILIHSLEGDSLSPQRGEAARAKHPPDPSFLEGFNRASKY
jgi:hypothetical protein